MLDATVTDDSIHAVRRRSSVSSDLVKLRKPTLDLGDSAESLNAATLLDRPSLLFAS
jgi:hypothetical protein